MRVFLVNTRVFKPFSSALDNATIVLEGTKIVSVGRDGQGPVPDSSDRVIDCGGATVMPGMVVGHWHPDYPNFGLNDLGTKYIGIGMEKPPGYLAALSVKHLGIALMSGFTGVVGAGCGHDVDVAMKMAIEEGVFDGPRIRAAGHHINTTSSDNDRTKWWYNLRPYHQDGISILGAELMADGEDALRRAVRDEIRRGVEIIKTFPTGGHGIPPVPGYRGFTPGELRVICETAHDRGALVRGHVVGRDAILECIAAGVDIIDHADRADDDCIEAMLKAGTFLVPSQLFLKRLLGFPKGALPDSILGSVRHDFETTLSFVPRAHKAGVRIIPGDDYGLSFMPHELGIYAQDLMIHIEEAGIAAQDVLGWATEHGAALMGRSDLGRIEEGRTAELLIVDGDPVANPSILTDPATYLKAIVMDGRFVKDETASLAGRRQGQPAMAAE